MIEIDLITGFLGSGKTTFIQHYGQYLIHQGIKIAIIENDFGAINVDMMLLSDTFKDQCIIEMIANDGDKETYQRRLKAKLIALKMQGIQRVIIEPSGLFVIDELEDVLYEEPLSSWYNITNVLTLVDSNLDTHLSNNALNVLKNQIIQAGIVILTKADLSTDIQINQTKEFINTLVNDRKIPITLFDPHHYKDYSKLMNVGYYSPTIHINNSYRKTFQTVFIMNQSLSKQVCLDKIKTLFNNVTYGNIFRIKGFVLENNEWFQINATSHQTTILPIKEGQDVLIVIGEELQEEKIKEFMK